MTRPTLLQLLAHPATLTGVDVHELEQLALAFPYCQTAHLLLAKAAHDQGSMLAGQRLRRAATYAADRALLRQLIETKPTPSAELVLAEVEDAVLVGVGAEVGHLPAVPALALLPSATDLAELDVVPTAANITPADLPQPEQLASEALPEEGLPKAEVPAQAPPIWPPEGAVAAQHEFGLAATEPAEITAYRLSEAAAEPTASAIVPAKLPPFSGVADISYAFGEGSRLGFCLQCEAPADYGLLAGPEGLLPGVALPPADEFFAPDALFLAHVAANQATVATPPASDAKELINSFLQRAPQAAARRRAVLPPLDAEEAEQPDLSGRSTQAVPDLASENLAKILARQGKTDRAIAIYERLMVKQPEKMAYFAAQIDFLRLSA